MNMTVNLSTLGLPAGTHSITVKARAAGYNDSAESNAVSYTAEGEETYTLSGTWVFNEEIETLSPHIEEYIPFSSNDETFIGMLCYSWFDEHIDYGENHLSYISIGSPTLKDVCTGNLGSYTADSWQDEAYRTITFDGEQTVTKKFYDWFTANATPYGDGTVGLAYSLSDDGTYYTCTGIGTATDNDIVIAGTLNGVPVKKVSTYAFDNNTTITSVTIQEGITEIGAAAFWNCSKLTSVSLPDGLLSIDQVAFKNCSKLATINIPDSVTYIGLTAFQNSDRVCTKVNGMYYVDNWAVHDDENVTFASTYSIRDGTVGIADNALGVGVKILNIPSSVKHLSYGFAASNTLETIEISADNEYYTSVNGVAYTKDMKTLLKYPDAKAGTSFTIPSSVVVVDRGAFVSSNNLTSITIPEGVEIISCQSLGWCNFRSIVIPDSATSIEDEAFIACTKLTSVTIGKGVVSIGDDVFSYCSKLTSITVDDDNAAYKTILGSLYTKDGKNLIRYAVPTVSAIFTIPDGVTHISSHAIDLGDTSILKSVVIPNSVKSIDENGFWSCGSITSVKFNGTISEWNSIEKIYHWDWGLDVTYVPCTDGTVSI